ncbi:hypothetical protein [Chondrinema litorale]|uniref:hypothetical protein n=1 Tax=Chondrinema litorale TaxID=2994555 RepID=UPI0025431D48|nr:hypothetical protein [Chondrinema litorale]UZR92278.1 hypothetical protein OQ292_10415 [Chondrinema litorale]
MKPFFKIQHLFTAFILFISTVSFAQNFSGNYVLKVDPSAATMQLSDQGNGTYAGYITGPSGKIDITGRVQQGILAGDVSTNTGKCSFAIMQNGNDYVLSTTNYDAYGRPMPATTTYLYFVKNGVNNSAQPTVSNQIYFNGIKASSSSISQLENYYRVKVMNGRYWYDNVSGMWGLEGGPTLGVLLPNLQLGGQLRANASNGNTNVFINGRNLPQQDLMVLQSVLGYIQPGRYWIDGNGNAGKEGGPALINLRQAVAANQQSNTNYNTGGNNNSNSGSKNTFYRNSYTGIGAGSDGETSYVIGDGFSYIGN